MPAWEKKTCIRLRCCGSCGCAFGDVLGNILPALGRTVNTTTTKKNVTRTPTDRITVPDRRRHPPPPPRTKGVLGLVWILFVSLLRERKNTHESRPLAKPMELLAACTLPIPKQREGGAGAGPIAPVQGRSGRPTSPRPEIAVSHGDLEGNVVGDCLHANTNNAIGGTKWIRTAER